jgi:glycosyltransferase involved in cell wall biosynthesis
VAKALVSVITTAYNARHTLARAIMSLRAQSWADWCHVIIDDGSVDETEEIARHWSRLDNRISVISRRNGGIGAALNTGVSAAEGDYIAFLDADDEYLPTHLEKRIRFLQKNSQIDLLWGGMQVMYKNTQDTLVPDLDSGAGVIPILSCCVTGTLVGKREVFQAVPFSEDRSVWNPDYEFLQRVKKRFSVSRFRLATYRYYRNSGASAFDKFKASGTMQSYYV